MPVPFYSSAWYTWGHSKTDSAGKFEGAATFDYDEVTPSEVKAAVGKRRYSFVFLNECDSADGSPAAEAMKQNWNCDAYLGISSEGEKGTGIF